MSICVALHPFSKIENAVNVLEGELIELSFMNHQNVRHLINLQKRTVATRQELAYLSPNDIDAATLHDLRYKLEELALNFAYYHANATGSSPHQAMAALREFYAEADKESEVHD